MRRKRTYVLSAHFSYHGLCLRLVSDETKLVTPITNYAQYTRHTFFYISLTEIDIHSTFHFTFPVIEIMENPVRKRFS